MLVSPGDDRSVRLAVTVLLRDKMASKVRVGRWALTFGRLCYLLLGRIAGGGYFCLRDCNLPLCGMLAFKTIASLQSIVL